MPYLEPFGVIVAEVVLHVVLQRSKLVEDDRTAKASTTLVPSS